MEYRARGYPGIGAEEWGGSPKVYCCRECAWVYVSAGIFHPQDELLSLCTWAMKVPDGSLIGNGLHKSREQSHPDSWHHHRASSWTLAPWTFPQPPPTHSAAATPWKAAGLICSHHQTLSARCPTEEGQVLASYSSSLWWPQQDRACLTSQRPFFVKGKLGWTSIKVFRGGKDSGNTPGSHWMGPRVIQILVCTVKWREPLQKIVQLSPMNQTTSILLITLHDQHLKLYEKGWWEPAVPSIAAPGHTGPTRVWTKFSCFWVAHTMYSLDFPFLWVT